jgi:hypothetical protein
MCINMSVCAICGRVHDSGLNAKLDSIASDRDRSAAIACNWLLRRPRACPWLLSILPFIRISLPLIAFLSAHARFSPSCLHCPSVLLRAHTRPPRAYGDEAGALIRDCDKPCFPARLDSATPKDFARDRYPFKQFLRQRYYNLLRHIDYPPRTRLAPQRWWCGRKTINPTIVLFIVICHN